MVNNIKVGDLVIINDSDNIYVKDLVGMVAAIYKDTEEYLVDNKKFNLKLRVKYSDVNLVLPADLAGVKIHTTVEDYNVKVKLVSTFLQDIEIRNYCLMEQNIAKRAEGAYKRAIGEYLEEIDDIRNRMLNDTKMQIGDKVRVVDTSKLVMYAADYFTHHKINSSIAARYCFTKGNLDKSVDYNIVHEYEDLALIEANTMVKEVYIIQKSGLERCK